MLEITAERTAKAERPGGAIESTAEIAQVFAIGVGDFAVEGAHSHLRLINRRVKPMPRKAQPIDFCVGAEALAPVQPTAELQ